jgi:hypothetical protein
MPPEVKVRLVLDGTPEAVAAMHKFAQESQGAGKKAGDAFKPLHDSLGGVHKLLGALGIAFGVGEVVNFMKETVKLSFEMRLLSEMVGTTVGNMSALATVARLTDTETKTLTSGLGLLGRKIDALKAGAPDMIEAFGRIGLTAKDFPTDDIAVAAETVAIAMEKHAKGYTKAAVAAAIMGRNGKALLPMFHEMVKLGGLAGTTDFAKRTGFYVDESTVALFHELVTQMKALKMEAMGASLEFLKGFGPEAVAMVETLSDSIDRDGVGSIQRMGKATGEFGRWFSAVIQSLGAELEMNAAQWKNTAAALSASFRFGATSPQATAAWAFANTMNKLLRERMLVQEKVIEQAAQSEHRIQVLALQREQDIDDQRYHYGTMSLDKYMEARNSRIRREFSLEAGYLRMQIETLRPGAMTTEDFARIKRWEDEIVKIQKETDARLAEGAPDRNKPLPKAIKQPLDLGVQKAALEEALRAERENNAAMTAADRQRYEAGLESLNDYYVARRKEIRQNYTAEFATIREEEKLVAQEKDPVKREALERELQARREKVIAQAAAAYLDVDRELAKAQLNLRRTVLEESAKLDANEANRHEQAKLRILADAETLRIALVQSGVDPALAAAQSAEKARVAQTEEDFQHLLNEATTALQSYEAKRKVITEQMRAHLISQGEGETQLAAIDAEYLPGLNEKLAELRRNLSNVGPEAVAAFDAFAASLQKAKSRTSDLAMDIRSGLTTAIGNFFGNAILQAKNFGDAIRQLTVMIAQMIMQLLAMRFAQAAVNFLWPVAAAAGGGLIVGPGGPRDDRIPAMLSNREYVVPAHAVALPGVLGMLEGLRTGRLRSVSGFAEGGLVTGGTGAGRTELGGQLTVALEEGLVLRALESRAGQEALIRITSKNRRAIGSALR